MKMISMIKYQLKTYFKGSSFVMPFLLTVAFLFIMYSQKPIDVLSGFLVSGVFLFFLMVWIGISSAQQEDKVMEQILYFKVNNAFYYYAGKLLFLLILALIFSCFCVVFPILQNLLNGNALFNRTLVAADLISAFFILYASAICGAFLGNAFHPRIIKDRRMAFAIAVLFCILSFAKESIILQTPMLKYILWIFPPIMLPSKTFSQTEYFNVGQSVPIFLVFLLYALCFGLIKSIICHKKRF